MLAIFPDLLTYGLLGPLLIRLTLGLLFIDMGYFELTREQKRWRAVFETLRLKPVAMWSKGFGILQIVGGILLIAGMFTQVAALFFAIISLAEIFIEYREPAILKRNIVFYLLIFVMSLSLLFSGAGFYAFDLPL